MSQSHRHAFSMIEILFVIAVVSLMVALTMPALGKAKSYAEYVRWATQSHNLQADPDLLAYWNFQDQLAESAELWNRAAGPVLGSSEPAAPTLESVQLAMAQPQGLPTLAAASPTLIDGLGRLLPNLLTGALVDPADLNGTFGGPNSWGDYDHPKWVQGRWEHKMGLAFDSSSVVYGTNHSRLNLGKDDFTIMYWYKLDKNANYGGIVFARVDPNTKDGFYLAVEANEGIVKPVFHAGKGDGYSFSAYIPTFLKDETRLGDANWHQVVYVRKGDRLSVWTDGEKSIDRFQFTHDLSADAVYTLGNGDMYGYGSFYFGFPGVIDEMGIYRRALSEKEIADLYIAGKPQMAQEELE